MRVYHHYINVKRSATLNSAQIGAPDYIQAVIWMHVVILIDTYHQTLPVPPACSDDTVTVVLSIVDMASRLRTFELKRIIVLPI